MSLFSAPLDVVPPWNGFWSLTFWCAVAMVLGALVLLSMALTSGARRQKSRAVEEQIRLRLLPHLAGREGLAVAAVELLEEFGHAPTARVLRRLRREMEGDVVEKVAEALDMMGETARQARRARSILPSQRLRGIRGLGDCGGVAGAEALRGSLGHPSATTRMAAREALLRVGSLEAARESYLAFVEGTPAPRKEDAGFVVQVAHRHPEVLMERLARSSHQDDHFKLALDALGHAGVDDVVTFLPQSLESENPEVRAAAARVAGGLRHWQSRPQLISMLQDETWFVRASAAGALGNLPFDDAIDPLVSSLSDRRWWVRRNAARGLSRHGEAGVGALLRALRDPGVAGEAARLVLFDVSGSGTPPASGSSFSSLAMTS